MSQSFYKVLSILFLSQCICAFAQSTFLESQPQPLAQESMYFQSLTENRPGDCLRPDKKCLQPPFSTMETPTGPHLLLFLSFSAPSDTWKSFSADLQALGGTIVLRGLPNNSFQEFALRIKHLKEEGVDVPIQIDPDAFERYNIEAVPTLVLAHKEISDQLTGNLTISSTLQRFKESGSLQHEASLLLSKLKHPYEKTNE